VIDDDRLYPVGDVPLQPGRPETTAVWLAVARTEDAYGPESARRRRPADHDRPDRGVERELGLAVAPHRGLRDYVLARPLLRLPDYRLTVRLGASAGPSQPPPGPARGAIGTVEGVEDRG
jgi:hypothetical protein